MKILRTLLRVPLAIGLLLFRIGAKSLRLTLLAVAAGALLMVLDTLLLDADSGRPDESR